MSAACCSRGAGAIENSTSPFFLSLSLSKLARSRAREPSSFLSPRSSRGRSALALGIDGNPTTPTLTGTCRSARGSRAESAQSCRARSGLSSPRRRWRPRLPSKELRCVPRSPWLLLLLFEWKEGECASEREAACVECCCKVERGREEKRRGKGKSCLNSDKVFRSSSFFLLRFDLSFSPPSLFFRLHSHRKKERVGSPPFAFSLSFSTSPRQEPTKDQQ